MTAIFPVKKQVWALFALIVLGTNVCGVVSLVDLPSISLGRFGRFLIHDLLLLLLLGFMFAKLIATRSILTRSSISYPLMAFILLTVVESMLSFARGVNPHYLMRCIRPYLYYLLYFLVLFYITNKDELIQFMVLVVAAAVISVGITYYQSITGNLILSDEKRFQYNYGLYQSLNSGEVLMPCAFLILFSLLIGKKRYTKYFLITTISLIWIGGGILIMLVRGLWISLFLAVWVVIIINKSQTRKAIIVLSLLFIGAISVYSIIEHISGSTSLSYVVKDRVQTAAYHSSSRANFMRNSFIYLFDNPSLFGGGFKNAVDIRGNRYDPALVTFHNLPADLAARYGFSGFIVFGWLLFAVFRQGRRLLRMLPVSWQKSVVLGLLAFNIQTLVYGYSSNSYFLTPGIVILAPSWAMLELIERLHKHKQIETLL